MRRFNGKRGEVLATLGGQEVRLCVTLRALAELESYFDVSGFEALGDCLKRLGAADLQAVLGALIADDSDISRLDIAFPEAIRAVVSAFEAMNGH